MVFMKETELAWLAGLLEGEGTFSPHRSRSKTKVYSQCRVQIQMSDYDVIRKVARLTGSKTLGPYSNVRSSRPSYRGRNPLPCWVVSIVGKRAEDLMRKIRPYMGKRRKSQIDKSFAEKGNRKL